LWKNKHPTTTVRKILAACSGRSYHDNLTELLEATLVPEQMKKFRNAIINVDGVLASLILVWAQKPEFNDWEYVDRVVVKLVKSFVDDLFEENPDLLNYKLIKEVKQKIKCQVTKERSLTKEDMGGYFFFEDILPLLNEKVDTRLQLQRLSIISQTRSIGIPPNPLRLAAYEKYYKTVTFQDRELTSEERSIIRGATNDVWRNVVKKEEDFYSVLSRCQMHEKVSLSTSADLLNSTEAGGKLKSANQLINAGFKVPVVNLETGKLTGSLISKESIENGVHTIGELIFYHSVNRFKHCFEGKKDPILFTVKPVAVADQGKYRIATAGHPDHASLLQPVAQLLKSAFLRLESTRGGMDKQHHMWEFYKRIQPYMVNDLRMPGDPPKNHETFFYFEDWSMATDNFHKHAAAIMMHKTLEFLGVPRFYSRLCELALTAPRINMLNPGEKIPDNICPQMFISQRGIFQGDPVTKNMLQLCHIVSREVASQALNVLSERNPTPAYESILRGRTENRKPNAEYVLENNVWIKVNHLKASSKPVSLTGPVYFRAPIVNLKMNKRPLENEQEFRKLLKEFLTNDQENLAKGKVNPFASISRSIAFLKKE